MQLKQVMSQEGITQTRLSRMTGISQGRISNYVNGTIVPGPENLNLLFGTLGMQVQFEPVINPVHMGRSEMRSWLMHRQLSTHLRDQFESWKPKLFSNIERLRNTNKGEPHLGNIERWRRLVEDDDIPTLRMVMLDPGREGQEMREVGPFTGLLPQDERDHVLSELHR